MNTGPRLAQITDAVTSAVLAGFSLLIAIGMGAAGTDSVVAKVVAIAASVTSASFVTAMYAAMALSELAASANAKEGAQMPAFVSYTAAFHIGLFGLLVTLGAAGFFFGQMVGVVTSACAGLAIVFVVRIALWANDAYA